MHNKLKITIEMRLHKYEKEVHLPCPHRFPTQPCKDIVTADSKGLNQQKDRLSKLLIFDNSAIANLHSSVNYLQLTVVLGYSMCFKTHIVALKVKSTNKSLFKLR